MRLASGVVHQVPLDLKRLLNTSKKTRDSWNELTPLSRNEWICWVISVKKPTTRKQHIKRVAEELAQGKRRPCCWPGCSHRNKK